MKPKVTNCGNYNCAHCSCEGQCLLTSISVTSEGRCALYKVSTGKAIPTYLTEQDEHTNMC